MMAVTVQDVMRQVRNHFVAGSVCGQWEVVGGQMPAAFLPGSWIAIPEGPLMGVWQLDEGGAIPGGQDAVLDGTVYLLEPPEDFLRLCEEIAQWSAAHPDPSAAAERFGEYSRSQSPGGWDQVFQSVLAPYRRMFAEVTV